MGYIVWFAVFLILVAFLPSFTNGKVRFYACYACYFIFISVTAVVTSPLLIFYYKNPVFIGINSSIMRHIIPLLGIEWEIRNKEKLLKGKKGIIVLNHINSFDVLGLHVLHQYMGTYSALSKKELLFLFPWGIIHWLGGLIFVDRKCQKSKAIAMKTAADYFNRGVKIVFFAEGTRNRSNEKLLTFKRGAFQMAIERNAGITPVVISPYSFLDYDKKIFGRGKVILSVLDEISVEGMTVENVDTLMIDTRLKMSEEFVRLSREVGAI